MGAHDTATDALTDRQAADEMERVNDRLRARVGDLEAVNVTRLHDQIDHLTCRSLRRAFRITDLEKANEARAREIVTLTDNNMGLAILAEQRRVDLRAATMNKRRRGATIKRQRAEIAQWKDLAEQQRLSLVAMRKMLPASCR